MRDSWQIVALGELARQSIDPISVEPEVAYVNLGVQWYAKGVFFREPKIGSEIKAKTLFRVRPGQFIYNRLFATEGSFALVTAEAAEGVVSNEFPVFDLDEQRILPDFLFLHFQQPAIWEQVAAECVGTTKSRKRWKEDRFTQHVIALPPLVEQRCIVDLIGTIDDTIESVETAHRRLEDGRSSALEALFAGRGPRIEIGSLLEGIVGGRSPKASDTPPEPHEFGVLKVSAVTKLGFVPSESKRVSDVNLFSDVHRVRVGDVLITRANTAALVGQTCLVDQAYPNLFLSDKTLRLIPVHGVPGGALVAALNAPTAREQLSGLGTGTSSSMKNISQSDIRRVQIAWPDDPHVAAEMDRAFHDGLRALREQSALLKDLRGAVLSSLLSGRHEIPESYNELIEEVA